MTIHDAGNGNRNQWSGAGISASPVAPQPRPRMLRRVRVAALGVSGFVSACGGAATEDEWLEVDQRGQALTASTSFRNGALPTSSYSGSTDATIRQSAATSNAGGASTCEADGDDGSGTDKSCLLRWTLTGIPAGAHVDAASISLQVVNATANTYEVYELERSFNESQVTWNLASTSVPWATAGALGSTDRGSLLGSVTGGTGTRTINLNAAGTALVQSWVDGLPNHGAIIASATSTDGIDFASSEATTINQRPTLNVTYTTSGSGGTGGTGGSGGTGGTGGTGGSGGSGGGGSPTAQNLLVAFIGDQGNNSDSSEVLGLIASEGADAVVHNGDFDYADNPTAWENRINSVLGANFPYFAVVGNHDAAAWGGANGYAAKIAARHARVPEMQCSGELGVKASCNFRGLQLIQSCVGTSELRSTCGANSSDQVNFIRDSLANDDAIFSVCSWHKNQHDMQVGTKGNEVGWNAYQECMDAGAIISTGHEHSYSRTLTLTDVGNAAAGHGAVGAFNLVELGAGSTFAFVSGLAGVGIRAFSANNHDDDTWWASYNTSDRWVKNGVNMSGVADYGVLFIEFYVNGIPTRARAYFKDVSGRLMDEFTIEVQ